MNGPQNVRGRNVWTSGFKRGRRRVFQAKLNLLRCSFASNLSDQGQRKVNSRGYAPSCQQIAIPDYASWVGNHAKNRQEISPCPVTGCMPACDESGRGQNQ